VRGEESDGDERMKWIDLRWDEKIHYIFTFTRVDRFHALCQVQLFAAVGL
jgi:hypothetical protein